MMQMAQDLYMPTYGKSVTVNVMYSHANEHCQCERTIASCIQVGHMYKQRKAWEELGPLHYAQNTCEILVHTVESHLITELITTI